MVNHIIDCSFKRHRRTQLPVKANKGEIAQPQQSYWPHFPHTNDIIIQVVRQSQRWIIDLQRQKRRRPRNFRA